MSCATNTITGPPSPGVAIKVLDPESGLPVPPGQTGILHGQFITHCFILFVLFVLFVLCFNYSTAHIS